MPGLVDALSDLLGADLGPFVLGWARALPVVTLVPAFGLGGVAVPIRVVLGLGMGVAVAPGLAAVPVHGLPFWFVFLREAAHGLPVALATSAALWAAVMAGGLVDTLRGARDTVELPVLEEPSSPFAVLFGLFVGLGFLEAGGAERLVRALAEPRSTVTFAVAATRLADSIGVAVALAAPLVAGAVLLELGSALLARAASPAYVAPLLAPLRALGVLVVAWLVLARIAELSVLLATHA
ncbi:MAG TPA: flagellar biosynthetic protein FliR [Polyangiaceae bacterium]|jgi:type III secretory pathway component EscT|nr:flagellar biosynthetic protein FliR [Polyangiaceae bacterium]